MADQSLLKNLSKQYPDIKSATQEIVNLSAILSLPKGTEYYLSDLHREHEAFIHMLKSASGVIKNKIDEIFGPDLSSEERDALASLVYNAEAEIKRRKKSEKDFDQWCKESILRLVYVCKSVCNKYTQSKIRKRLPKAYAYIIDELLHADDEANMGNYYTQIINTMVECRVAEEFIIEMAEVISSLAVERPVCLGGAVPIETSAGRREIPLIRIHMEEDAGKLIHRGEETLIDYNRAGVPLIEIVSEPALRTPEEAKAYVNRIEQTVGVVIRWISVGPERHSIIRRG